jgi:hypothetical protein
MKQRWSETRTAWLVCGIVIGLAIALYWPHEPAMAEVVDRSEKFAMCTSRTQAGSSDAVFVLDFVTGRLVGGAYMPQAGGFQAYARNIAADFNIDAGTPAQYTIAPAFIEVRAGGAGAGGGTPANGAIYVGEMNSGRVILYGFMVRATSRPGPPLELRPLATFPFREAL